VGTFSGKDGEVMDLTSGHSKRNAWIGALALPTESGPVSIKGVRSIGLRGAEDSSAATK